MLYSNIPSENAAEKLDTPRIFCSVFPFHYSLRMAQIASFHGLQKSSVYLQNSILSSLELDFVLYVSVLKAIPEKQLR
jgi:hypothetical protein